jgi:hypothetical protein
MAIHVSQKMASNPESQSSYPPCPIKPLYYISLGWGLHMPRSLTLNNNCYIHLSYLIRQRQSIY